MNEIVRNVLKQFSLSGFEAYIVGGYVRDYLLGEESNDVDICTNALPKDILKIFEMEQIDFEDYRAVQLKKGKYFFDITTYRKEIRYENRKPVEIVYIHNLLDDLKRRDFKMNTLCMNEEGKIIDPYLGTKDISERLISTVGDAYEKLEEDPLRILRALRFAITLDFELDASLKKAIMLTNDLVLTLSKERIKKELDQMFLSKYTEKIFPTLEEYGILELCDLKPVSNFVFVEDICGIWAQIETGIDYSFSKQEKKNIEIIRNLINKGTIEDIDLFDDDFYLCQVAGKILGIDCIELQEQYQSLPIHAESELTVSIEEMLSVGVETTELAKMRKELTLMIITKMLRNEKTELVNYLKHNAF